jgi:hypothetical protein
MYSFCIIVRFGPILNILNKFYLNPPTQYEISRKSEGQEISCFMRMHRKAEIEKNLIVSQLNKQGNMPQVS